MRRWPTWLVVGGLIALGAVAAADALRGGEETTLRPAARTGVTTVELVALGGMRGVLYYSAAATGCRLAGLALPTLRRTRAPELTSCRYSLSPDGGNAVAERAAWSPSGGLYAREVDGMIELASPVSGQALRFPGRAPAFKPNGTFTFVRENVVVEWTTACPADARLFTLPGDNATARCTRELLGAPDLRRALPSDSSVLVTSLAWLSDTRLAAVVRGRVQFSRREAVAIFERRQPVAVVLGDFGEGLYVEASPRGGYLAAWYGDSLYGIRDRDGNSIAFPPLPRVRALAWSPDERWTAAATEHSVYVFRTNEGEARMRRLPILARDLAWR